MALNQLPKFIQDNYECHEWKHACAILATDFPDEWNDIMDVLTNFRLLKSNVGIGGGNKGPMAKAFDGAFIVKGWKPKNFDTKVVLDGNPIESPTHEIDCFKNSVAVEIEWNNKDPFFDRDLNNFRLLFELRAISVGVIITRCTHLHEKTFMGLPTVVRKKYGASTTHMNKLLPKLHGGGGGGCPILVFGISGKLWVDDLTNEHLLAVLAKIKEDRRKKKLPPEEDEET